MLALVHMEKRGMKLMRSENMHVKIKISRKFRLSENGFVKLIQSLSTITAVKAISVV